MTDHERHYLVAGVTRRAAVLGHPVAHSRSPVLHAAAYEALGLTDWEYQLHDVDEHELAGFLERLDDSWAGLSLTMPLKHEALRLADHVDGLAKVVGAANTLLRQPGGLLVAANTDVHGLVASLREVAPAGWQPRSAVIVGGGATASSALAAVGELGVHHPVVLARSLARVGAVRRAAAKTGLDPEYVALDRPGAPELLRSADIVILTLPQHAADPLAEWFTGANLSPSQVLLDAVYADWPTAAAAAWEQAGGTIASGFLMLLHQACEQVRLMTGHEAPVDAMRQALTDSLARA
ncbi:shikimate dehydrogenase [Ruania alkalisoli]|uniref:Shikimate dehydrogenase n=1 Tax=Ruania alkalisoli TaxID=2779775 RepID=A0A7M1SYB7_9MICO|nr:shikimate dehydrogenase [Ruania alkalisoli]QOR72501.1 shikimate dehydrogenase [Ruania alkalisoli]